MSLPKLLSGCAAVALLSATPVYATTYSPSAGTTQTVSTPITTGSVDMAGPGTLVLSGTNSYAGGTNILGGTLSVGADVNLGAATGGVTLNGGTLYFNNSFDPAVTRAITLGANGGTLSTDSINGIQSISGTGNLTIGGSGVLGLHGVSSYTGQTILLSAQLSLQGSIASSSGVSISGGSFIINDGNYTIQDLSGSGGTVVLGAFSHLTFGTANSTTLGSAIVGVGELIKTGSGTVTLTNLDVHTGGTVISAGALQVNTYSLHGDVTDNASLIFDQAYAGTFTGAISGTGSITKQNAGTLTLTSASNYTGQTTISAGTLTLGAGSSISTSSGVALSPGATLDVTSGPHTIQNLSGDGGSVLIGSYTLSIQSSTDTTYAGTISGNGGILGKFGSGTLTLSGINTYTGNTSIVGGALLVSADANLGAPTAPLILESGTLKLGASFDIGPTRPVILNSTGQYSTFDTNGFNMTIAGLYGTGGSGLNKAGLGTLTLTGYVTLAGGSTSVSEGVLEIGNEAHNGLLDSRSVYINGGTLTGNGTIQGNVYNAGAVALGGSVGTLAITGNYLQQAAGTLKITVTPTNAPKLAVTGTAQLDGALQFNPTGLPLNQPFTVLTADGGVTGQFSSIGSTLPTLSFTATYEPTAVEVEFTGSSFSTVAQTGNQAALARLLDSAPPGSPLSTLSLALANSASVQHGLDQLSGEAAGGGAQAAIGFGQAFGDAIGQAAGGAASGPGGNLSADAGGMQRVQLASLDPQAALADGPSPPGSGLSAWMQGFGAFGRQAGDGSAHGFNSTLGGGAFGIDHDYGNGLLAGVAIGYGHTDYSVRGLPQSGSADTYALALYGGYVEGPNRLSGSLGYGRVDTEEKRTLASLDGSTAKGSADGNQFLASAEYGYRTKLDADMALTPFVALNASHLSIDGFTESGSSLGNLVVAGQDTDSLRSTLGAHASRDDVIDDRRVSSQATLGWSHEFASTRRSVRAAFLLDPSAGSFATQAARPANDALIVGLGSALALDQTSQIYVRYNGDLASGDTTHAITAGYKMSW